MWADDFQKLIVQEDPVQANNEYMIYRLFGEHEIVTVYLRI
jgi:hypothetical protein